jgi:hypothetical protein
MPVLAYGLSVSSATIRLQLRGLEEVHETQTAHPTHLSTLPFSGLDRTFPS